MHKQRSLIALGIFAVMVLAAVASPSSGSTIYWRPVSNPQYAVRGETRSLSVTFSTLSNLYDAEVRVSPELQSFVTVSPTNLGFVPSGSVKTLTLTLTSAANAELGTVTGALAVVRSIKPQTTYGQPLSLSVTVDPFPLPPDPGKAGKQTLEGIDSDGDGVRDDLQRYIAITYPDNQPVRVALTQLAVPRQSALLEASNRQKALTHASTISRAKYCLRYRMGISESALAGDKLLAKLLNTQDRSRAYVRYDNQLSGMIFPFRLSVNEADCDN